MKLESEMSRGLVDNDPEFCPVFLVEETGSLDEEEEEEEGEKNSLVWSSFMMWTEKRGGR